MANKKNKSKTKTKKYLAREQREARQTRILIIITAVVGIVILGLIVYGAIDQFIIQPRKPVAQVGDTTITMGDFESRVQYTRVQYLNQIYQYYTFHQQFGEFGASFLQTAQNLASQLSQPVTVGQNVLDQLIDSIIIKEEAAKRGITASEEEIDEAFRAAFGFFPDGTPTPTITSTLQSTPTLSETQLALVTLTSTPTPVDLEVEGDESTPSPTEESDTEDEETDSEDEDTGLTETESESEETPTQGQEEALNETPTPQASPTITLTPTPYTTEEFGENIDEFKKSYSPYNFEIEDLRDIFTVEILREKLIDEITADLEPVQEEVWARHILVETEEEALEVLSLLAAGEDFHDIAAVSSIDDSNKDQGGDLGWFDKDTMVPEFTETAFSMEIGEISDPVETSFGFHIIQVLGKRDAQIPPNEFEQEKETVFIDWLNEIRNARTDIVIYDGWEENVPTTPAVPQQLLVELFQQQQ